MARLTRYLTPLAGLVAGYLAFHQLSRPETYAPGRYGPDFILHVLATNISFAIFLFLLGSSRLAQNSVLFLATFVSGAYISGFSPCVALLGTAPHGPLELAGFVLIAETGTRHAEGRLDVRLTAIGAFLLLAAAIVEGYATPAVLQSATHICGTVRS